jgi:hypothetical protein
MSDIATQELDDFFTYMWGTTEGFVYLPVQPEPYGPKDWQGFMFEWPRQKAGVIRHVLRHAATRSNVFYSPAIFSAASPKKDSVLGSWVLWADFDGNAPTDWGGLEVPHPTLIVQSSLVGHEHCYWRLTEFLTDIPMLEDRNRSIALLLSADSSGWDADQILRPIHTINRKRDLPVVIKEWDQ